MEATGAVSPMARLDQVALFGRPRMWIALISVLALLIAFVAWLVLARAPVTIPVSGVLAAPSGEIEATAVGAGPVIAVAFVPVSRASGIAVGQPVRVAASSAPVEKFGYVVGTVSDVATVPVSTQRLESLTASVAGLSESLVQDEPVIEVRIDLAEDPSTASGLKWTLGAGPPFRLVPGTIITGEVVQGTESPFARLFG